MLRKFLINWLVAYLLAVVAGILWACFTSLMLGPYLMLMVPISLFMATIVTYD